MKIREALTSFCPGIELLLPKPFICGKKDRNPCISIYWTPAVQLLYWAVCHCQCD